MESGWSANSTLSKSAGSAAAFPGRSYQISPIAPPSPPALLQGRKSATPQGFGNTCAHARSIAMTYLNWQRVGTSFAKEQQAFVLRPPAKDPGYFAGILFGGCVAKAAQDQVSRRRPATNVFIQDADRIIARSNQNDRRPGKLQSRFELKCHDAPSGGVHWLVSAI